MMSKIPAQYYLFAVIIFAVPLTSVSREIGYDYIEGTYSSISDSSIQNAEVDADGFSVDGSFSITPKAAITAGYGIRSYEKFQGLEVDFEELTLGLTAHTPISPATDISGNFSILNVEGEIDNGTATISEDDTGYIIRVGLIHLLGDIVDLYANVAYEDIFDDTANIFSFGLRLYASDIFSVGAGFREGNDDVDAVYLDVRLDLK